MKIFYIDFATIAKTGNLGPIEIGKSLEEISNIFQPPDYWQFGSGEFLWAYMGFGGVEVHFNTKDSRELCVNYAELPIANFGRSLAKFGTLKNGSNLLIKNDLGKKWLTFDFLKDYFKKNGISYTTDFTEVVSKETTAVMNFGSNLHFYFSNYRTPILEIISLSAPL
jgi:hypothetical protein